MNQNLNPDELKTFGQLKASGYQYRSVKEEMSSNLASRLREKKEVFSEIHGYEDTVLPQLI
ncbi:MAG: magnesium chelatase, partial [Spirochaetia bacterium]|nr:magnesium chelatase [Spirochaetia bacterium]